MTTTISHYDLFGVFVFSIFKFFLSLITEFIRVIDLIDLKIIMQIMLIAMLGFVIYFAGIAFVTYIFPFLLVCGKISVLFALPILINKYFTR